jgi:uncharacterized protein (DUF1810 family)
MPASSQQQQKLMGLALSYKRGNVSSSEVSSTVKKLADSMSEKELEKYAGTSHKGLPKKVGETKIKVEDLKKMVQDAVEEVMQERLSMKKLTPEQKQRYIESIGRYNEYKEAIYRSKQLAETVNEIRNIVEFASKNMVEESGDWFEGISHRRNSKKLKESFTLFEKTTDKIIKLQSTLESIYEGMGRYLSKFYEIKDKEK